jgi:transposase InsO family protein
MSELYSMLGVSRQSASQKASRMIAKSAAHGLILDLASQVRKDHSVMGCRKIYWKHLQEMPLGRDQCEQVLLSSGFRVKFQPNYRRTTYSIGSMYHPNLIEGLTLDGINQVWQTDITYFEIKEKFYYLVFIQDVYSRRIIGWSADQSMWAQANLRALEMALHYRKAEDLSGLIHHSDRGGQYIDKSYTAKLKAHHIKPSMCLNAWQNAYCERLNGIMKNEYLKNWKILDYDTLVNSTDRAVKLYNEDRPHTKLPERLCPSKFEQKLSQGLFRIKPTMKLYKLLDT